MSRKRGLTLGLHTEEERKQAFDLAYAVFEEAVNRVRKEGDADAVTFGSGYFKAIRDLANLEGAKELSDLMGQLMSDLVRAYDEQAVG